MPNVHKSTTCVEPDIVNIFCYASMQENYQLLENRLMAIRASKEQLDTQIVRKKEENRDIILEINDKKPILKSLEKKREMLYK